MTGWVLFALFCQPQFLLLGPLYRWLLLRIPTPGLSPAVQLLRVFGLTVLYGATEAVVPKLFTDTLGHGLIAANNVRQVADIGGTPLLTFLVVVGNFGFAQLWEHRREWRRFLAPVLLAAGLLLLAWGYGFWRRRDIERLMATSATWVTAAMVQGNIGSPQKYAAEHGRTGVAEAILRTYLDLSTEALRKEPKADFVVWPETAYPARFRSPRSSFDLRLERRVEAFVFGQQTPLVYGAYTWDGHKEYNSLLVLLPPGLRGEEPPLPDVQAYSKHRLLAFGEYLPGAETFPSLAKLVPTVGHLGAGPGSAVLTLATHNPQAPRIRLVPLICYEALFPDYVLEVLPKEPQLLLTIANDSWFGDMLEPQQHLELSSFRTIETRLPLLRVTNTGVTALVSPTGDILETMPARQAVARTVRVPLTKAPRTFFAGVGHWFGKLQVLLALVSVLGLLRVVKKGRLRSESVTP
jgi:apolipoprotein N-acyltransferase